MKLHRAGYTLIELLVTLSIVSILTLFTANISQSIESARRDADYKNLYQLAQYARSLSIEQQKVITLCGLKNGKTCVKNWDNIVVAVFFDENNNHHYDYKEPLYKQTKITERKIAWRGSNRNYMRFHPEGYLMDWGSYTLCPPSVDDEAIKLVFNRLGRAYKTTVTAQTIQNKKLCAF